MTRQASNIELPLMGLQEHCRHEIEGVMIRYGMSRFVDALVSIAQTQVEHCCQDSSGYGADQKNSWLATRGTLNVLSHYVDSDETGAFYKVGRRCEAKGTLPTPQP